MKIKYLFSSPEGDLPIGPEELVTQFKITPSENHPFFTLGDYFMAIRDFILKDQGKLLIHTLTKRFNEKIDLKEINEIIIRSEKHGALYHLASVEIFMDRRFKKFSVCTALSERGRKWLTAEYDTLKHLNETFNLSFLPKVHSKGEIEHHAGTGMESLSMFLAEWFEDYHEWHISYDEDNNRYWPCIWNLKMGLCFASEEETFRIFRDASKILSYYYNTQDFRQIYPWHHAAGDFVIKTGNGETQVRLTTARKYDPIMVFLNNKQINPLVAIIYFFLNLTIKMRLDRLDGVGEVVWVEDYSVKAVIEGFFEALQVMENEKRYQLGKVEDLLALLKSFDQKEFFRLSRKLLNLYREEDPKDFAVIERNLKSHTSRLHQTIQKFHI